jgi:predicted nucleic acid binding AN1-type Zn finger protein
MELANLGERCELDGCHQLDFLPFQCEYCHHTYCLKHRTVENHNCAHKDLREKELLKKNAQVTSCPSCKEVIVLSVGEAGNMNLGQKLQQHLSVGCEKAKLMKKEEKHHKACSHPKCKKIELVPITCKSCNLSFCLKHRFTQDHDCAGFKSININPTNKMNFSKNNLVQNAQMRNSHLLIDVQ